MSQERNQSIELLRIIMMSLVVFGHLLGFGVGGGRYNEEGTPTLCAILQPLYLYHVDAFVFISGYFGIRLRWNRFFEIILKMVLYSAVAYILALCIIPDMSFSATGIIKAIYPITTCDWWFMVQYLYCMLLSPFLNKGIDNLDEKMFRLLVIAMLIFSFRGFSCLLIFIYLLGRYLRLYPINMFEKHAGKIFLFTVTLFFLCNIVFLHFNLYPKKLYEYMSPFCIIPAVAIFYVFKRFQIKETRISIISSGVLVAYLITTHEILQIPFHKFVVEFVGHNVFILMLSSFFIVITASLFDKIINIISFSIKDTLGYPLVTRKKHVNEDTV